VKAYPTIGACGLDCGLCPRYYTVGSSRCPGCCGTDFFNKHPSCVFITCCVKKRGLEVCAECDEFPCSRFDFWKEDEVYDSFLTYRNLMSNLSFIKEHGVKEFAKQQEKRIELLETMLERFDEGRSKSFYCIAATLLPIEDLRRLIDRANETIKKESVEDLKGKARLFRETIEEFAAAKGISLKLRKPSKKKHDK
jgi:hypothetical protein